MPKILIVDDTAENRDVLKGLLESSYTLYLAKNGEQAIKLALKRLPDLILLDIMMPEMDGYEVCQRLKAEESTRDIPIIFVTAKGEMDDEKKGLEMGAVDYIAKPIKPPILLSRVRTHIELKEKRDALAKMLEIERELAKTKEDIERISRHDLKSPLNGIINYPPFIKSQGGLSEKQNDQLDKIVQLGRKMLRMINLSLDMFKMEQGSYEVKAEEVDLIQVFNEIKEDTKTQLKVKRLEIEILIDGVQAGESDRFILGGEKLLMYSMLSNLFKNAVEASPKKEKITLAMSKGEGISVSIHNQGTVPEEIRDTFFEKYATAEKTGGTGLGTYSAKLIAETLGGDISLDTSEEGGTTIKINFPKNGQDLIEGI